MRSLLTPQQVIEGLRQQNYKPVYFLQGPEAYYIDWITSYIASHIIPEEEKQLNLSIFHDKKQTIEQIILHAQQAPMIGKKKIIIVKEAQKLPDLQKASSQKLLIRYIKQPNKNTLLVFAYKNKTLDTNDSLAKALAQGNILLTCKTLYPNQISSWIHQYVHDKGYTIEQKAALQIQMMVGNNLQVLANELQKIIISLPKGHEIKHKTIINHIQSSKAFTLFDLQQAISHKNAKKISYIIQDFVQNPKKHPITQTISYLTIFFSKLLQLHHKLYKNAEQIAKHLQISPYLATTYIEAIQYYALPQTLQNIHYLHQADLQAKGIYFLALSEEAILKELIVKLIDYNSITTYNTEQPLNLF